MRITSIELAVERTRDGKGMPRAFARIGRKIDSEYINVTILMAGSERTHQVQADSADDLRDMAVCLLHELEGVSGPNSAIDDYYRLLERLSDI